MQEPENKLIEVQESTWPLRNDLRKLKNAIETHKCKLDAEKKDAFKTIEENCKWRNGRINDYLNNCLKHLDHIKMNLDNARKELTEYKMIVKETTGVDIDSQAKM